MYIHVHTFVDFSCVGIPCFNTLASCPTDVVLTPEGGFQLPSLSPFSSSCFGFLNEKNITFNG